jgi:hypothetical protein
VPAAVVRDGAEAVRRDLAEGLTIPTKRCSDAATGLQTRHF